MVERDERDERGVLLQALKGYLEELKETGVEELSIDGSPVSALPAAPGQLPAGEELPGSRELAAMEPPPVSGDGCSAVGDPHARLLFVMAGDGFAGEAGGLLVNIIKAMGFAAAQVHLITYPLDTAGVACTTRDALLSRIATAAPEVVVALGEPTVGLLLDSREPIGALRGRFHDLAGRPLMPSLHPEALLEDPALKREVWDEMKQVMARLAPRAR